MNEKTERKSRLSDIFSSNFFTSNKSAKKEMLEEDFIFEVKGGPLQTSLIEANLTKLNGEEVESEINWYSTGHNHEISKNVIKGNYYQPCADDIGKKICVQATPNLEEYQGMPFFKEIGPIEIDPKIQEIICENFHEKNVEFAFHFDSSNCKMENYNLDHLSILISKDLVQINSGLDSSETVIEAKIDGKFPKITFNRDTINFSFTLNFNEEDYFVFHSSDFLQRDIFALFLRAMNGMKVLNKGQSEELLQQNQLPIDALLRLESLYRENYTLAVEKDSLTFELQRESDARKNFERLFKACESDLRDSEKLKISQITELNDQLTKFKKIEKTKNYYMKEVKILQNKLQTMSVHNGNIQISKPLATPKSARNGYNHETDEELSTGYEFPFNSKKLESFDFHEEFPDPRNEDLHRQVQELRGEYERVMAEVNHWKKKYESLCHEKLITVTEPSNVEDNLGIEHFKEIIKQKDFEITKLLSKNIGLQNSVENFKAMLNNNEGFFPRPQMNVTSTAVESEVFNLRNLANRFAETITDKEIQLESQKMICKELAKKVSYLEETLNLYKLATKQNN